MKTLYKCPECGASVPSNNSATRLQQHKAGKKSCPGPQRKLEGHDLSEGRTTPASPTTPKE